MAVHVHPYFSLRLQEEAFKEDDTSVGWDSGISNRGPLYGCASIIF
jgi:hypothetical protein